MTGWRESRFHTSDGGQTLWELSEILHAPGGVWTAKWKDSTDLSVSGEGRVLLGLRKGKTLSEKWSCLFFRVIHVIWFILC